MVQIFFASFCMARNLLYLLDCLSGIQVRCVSFHKEVTNPLVDKGGIITKSSYEYDN